MTHPFPLPPVGPSEAAPIPVAVYMRVSSDDQRDRETIRTQRDTIERYLAYSPQYCVTAWYQDDGVSGTIPLEQRPQGRRLMAEARSGSIRGVIVTRGSRLGRDEVDQLVVYRMLKQLGVELIGVSEPLNDETMFGFNVIMNGAYRRQFLADSARGMERAAREGRYCGGIVPRGYRVVGEKQTARLVPNDETIIWGTWTEADLIRKMYHWVVDDEWTCRRIASHLNDLQVPTAYVRDGRGVRGKRTQGYWRAGHVRNIIVNPVYRGDLHYGRRSTKQGREVIVAQVPGIVSPELWHAAQAAFSRHRIMPQRPQGVYPLQGLMHCAGCTLRYTGARGREGVVWYRCGGHHPERGRFEGKCRSKAVKGEWIEGALKADVMAWLREPGELLERLQNTTPEPGENSEADLRHGLQAQLDALSAREEKVVRQNLADRITDDLLDKLLGEINAERAKLTRRLAELEPAPEAAEVVELPEDLRERLAARLEVGFTDDEWKELFRLLVKQVVVHTLIDEAGNKRLRVVVEYRFPRPLGVAPTSTGTDSSRSPA